MILDFEGRAMIRRRDDHHLDGTLGPWWARCPDGIIIVCLPCGAAIRLVQHTVDVAGRVSPSVCCTYDACFHEMVRLLDFERAQP